MIKLNNMLLIFKTKIIFFRIDLTLRVIESSLKHNSKTQNNLYMRNH
jgi:hypothetical protein